MKTIYEITKGVGVTRMGGYDTETFSENQLEQICEIWNSEETTDDVHYEVRED